MSDSANKLKLGALIALVVGSMVGGGIFEELLRQLGYDRFKVVAQHEVPRQRVPRPPRE